ncbi:unnamed protein product [Candidula unifasciata]|uniref:G-protein coupled receptors family 1 profile domain-containing protein n=1 Tax=Candidula unifasciata TaxID=100452 RepID=A0A8S3YPX6_9EUPU|nr:unnamed protein product [Candidula unifasciata]
MISTQSSPLVTYLDFSIPDRVVLTYTNDSFYFDFNSSFGSWENDTSSSPTPSAPSWWWSHYPSGFSWPHIIGGASIITVIILIIIFGNFLVIWAIIHDRTLKTTQNLFIASLAFADFFLGLIVIPFSLTNELIGYWLFGVIWCELYKAIDVLLCTASIMSLCLISLDRYWSITRAVHYARQRTRKRAAVMIFTVWFISAVVSIPPLIGWKQPTQESQWPLCNLSKDIGYVVYSALGSFFIPAFIMVFVYYKIYQAAKERARKTVKAPTCASDSKADHKHSTESSITDHGGNREDSHDIEDMTAEPDDGDGEDKVNEGTALDTTCESVAPTTSDDEANLQVRKAREVLASDTKEEYSHLLSTDSDSTEPGAKPLIRVTHGGDGFEPGPTYDIDISVHRPVSTTSFSNAMVPNDNHNNGSLRRFKIVELRANGNSAVSINAQINTEKTTVLESLRKHLLIRTKNSRKRKQTVVRPDVGEPVDFQTTQRQKRKLAKARERRATVVLGLVMAAFILCWLPFFALYLASAFCPGCFPDMVFSVFFWIGYCNSALNPIIYTVFNRDFRRAFQKIIFGRRQVRR